jgi:hypothetical protein
MTLCVSAQSPAGRSRQASDLESNQRQTANKDFKVLSYISEYKELIFLNGAWAVEWRPFTGSFITIDERGLSPIIP